MKTIYKHSSFIKFAFSNLWIYMCNIYQNKRKYSYDMHIYKLFSEVFSTNTRQISAQVYSHSDRKHFRGWTTSQKYDLVYERLRNNKYLKFLIIHPHLQGLKTKVSLEPPYHLLTCLSDWPVFCIQHMVSSSPETENCRHKRCQRSTLEMDTQILNHVWSTGNSHKQIYRYFHLKFCFSLFCL